MRKTILKMGVDVITLPQAINTIHSYTISNIGHYVCVSNVHMCMETFYSDEFMGGVNRADLVVPDGKPLVWAQRILGSKNAEQVRGMDLMIELCRHCEITCTPVGFYGGTENVLVELEIKLLELFPNLLIACSIAPPFRPLTDDENKRYVDNINSSGVKILFVGIGCPKQEFWMHEHKRQLSCVMLGVGAAFDFIAGQKAHAPIWMQNAGLEWLFRLICEPKRLWRRYLILNPLFIYYFIGQLLGRKYNK